MRSKRVHKSLRKKFSKKYNRSLRLKKRGGANNKKYIDWLDDWGTINVFESKENANDKTAMRQFIEVMDNAMKSPGRKRKIIGITEVMDIKDFFYPFSDDCFKKLSSINLTGVTQIQTGCFSETPSLTEIILPNIISIPNGAFEECEHLKTAYMPKAIKIQAEAFSGCHSLSNIEANRVEEIEKEAFDDCYYLKVIILPKIKRLGRAAFSGACVAHESIELEIPTKSKILFPEELIEKAEKGKAYHKIELQEAEERGKQKYLEEEEEKREEAERRARERSEEFERAREAYKRGDPDPDEVGDGNAMMWLKNQNKKRSKKSKKLTPKEKIGAEEAFEFGKKTFNKIISSKQAQGTVGEVGKAVRGFLKSNKFI